MRRVGAHRAPGIERHARIGAAFGAVAVHHVRASLRNTTHDMRHRDRIAWPDVARMGMRVRPRASDGASCPRT